jgi:hypothetical protein
VKALDYSRYDINGYHFWVLKLEASHPLAATVNNRVVANGEDASGLKANYCGILQKILEYMFNGAKELKVAFFNVIGLIQSTTSEWMILVWWR